MTDRNWQELFQEPDQLVPMLESLEADVDSGGGSVPGASRVLGPFPFAFDDDGLEGGIAFYTPTIGDILLDAWIEVDTNFDGTTPLADIGSFQGNDTGYYAATNTAVDLSVPDDSSSNPGLLNHDGAAVSGYGPVALSLTGAAFVNGEEGTGIGRVVPGKFITADPVLIVVSQDGTKGGDPVGGTAGAGAVYLVVATPSLT